jgi:hypothetical protein
MSIEVSKCLSLKKECKWFNRSGKDRKIIQGEQAGGATAGNVLYPHMKKVAGSLRIPKSEKPRFRITDGTQSVPAALVLRYLQKTSMAASASLGRIRNAWRVHGCTQYRFKTDPFMLASPRKRFLTALESLQPAPMA